MRHAVLIIGTVLALVLAAAAILPPLIDWSAYGGPIAARVQAATGRPVTIDGPIALRLLPTPSLSAGAVSIGNPPGMPGTLVRVEKLRLRLALGSLLGGKVRLEALELDKPELTLERAEDGTANWRFAQIPGSEPAATPPQPATATATASPPAPHAADQALPVERLTIHDGTLRLDSTTTLSGLDADIFLGGRTGPFRLNGSVRLGDTRVAVEGSAEHVEPGHPAPLSLTLRLPGDEGKLALSGTWAEDALRGRLTGAMAEPARALARLGLTPSLPSGALSLGTDLSLSESELALNNLDLSVGATRLTGGAAAALGAVPQVDVRLNAAALDLDAWKRAEGSTAPAPSAVPPRTEAPPAAAAPSPAPARPASGFSLPRELFASVSLGVEALSWRGQIIRQARLEAVLDGGEILLRQAGAQLPGGGELTLDGGIAAHDGAPVFDGTLRLKADNATALLDWLGAAPTGNGPRRLELTTPLVVAWPEIKAADIRLKTDTLSLRASAAARLDPQPVLAVNAALPGLEASLRGRLAGNGRVEDGAFALNAPQGLRQLRALGVSVPPAFDRLPVVAEGTGNGSAEAVALSDLKLRLGPSRLGGSAKVQLSGPRPVFAADLTADSLALDGFGGSERSGHLLPGGRLLPPSVAPLAPTKMAPAVQPAALAAGAGASPFSREPLDLSALNAADGTLSLRARTVTAKGWRLDDAVLKADLQNGTATIETLSGRLLGGELTATGKLSGAATPALALHLRVQGADLGAAKLSAAGMSVTQGRLDAEARFATSGRSSQDMAARLDGDATLTVRDGVLDGFDLPAINRQMGNLRNLGSILGVAQAGMSGGRTPFSKLAGTFRAENGVVVTRDLKLEAEGGGASADSSVNLPGWSTDTRIAFHLAAAPQVPVAFKLEGGLENPRKIIDLNAIQHFLVSQGLGKSLRAEEPANSDQPREKNTGKNILKGLLKGLGG